MDADAKFMQLAIDQARNSKEWLPCGAVIIQFDKLIAASYNNQHAANDPSGHAEINALRSAGKITGSKFLEGSTVYATCEPCVMCLSALMYAKVSRLVYGATLKEVVPKEKYIPISAKEFLKISPRKFEIVPSFMKEQCMTFYCNKP